MAFLRGDIQSADLKHKNESAIQRAGGEGYQEEKGQSSEERKSLCLRNGKKNGDKEGMSPRKQRRWEEVWSEGQAGARWVQPARSWGSILNVRRHPENLKIYNQDVSM